MIDIEVQNTFDAIDPTHEENRSTYYTHSLLRVQEPKSGVLDDEFFEKVKAARTVWLYLNPPAVRCNFTTIVDWKKEQIPGQPPIEEEESEDFPKPYLTKWSFIGLGGPVNKKYKDLYELLHVVFVADYTVEQKCDILEHKFGFTLTPELTQGLHNMFEFSQKIVAESLSQGRKEILDQLKAIKELIRSGQSLDEAMQAFNIPESEQASFRELLS